jgi:putative RecB family exonuclease
VTDPIVQRAMPSGLSPSSTELWDQCPRRFEKEKIEKRATGSGIEAVTGTYVHRGLEILLALPPEKRTQAAAYAAIREAWPETEESDDFKGLALSDEDTMQLRRGAMASMRSYFMIENPAEVNVVATERKLEAEIGGVPFRGIIDRLDRDHFGDYVVTDYKNGKVPIPRFQGPKMRQLNFYGAMVEVVDGILPVEGRLVFTAHAKEITTPITRRTVDAAIQFAVNTWDEVKQSFETDNFAPKTGPLCGWCPFASECPEGMADLRERRANKKLKKTAPNYDLAAPLEEEA